MKVRKYVVHYGAAEGTVVESIREKGNIEHLRHSTWGFSGRVRFVPLIVLDVPYVLVELRSFAVNKEK